MSGSKSTTDQYQEHKPEHILGAYRENGKVFFVVQWKNSKLSSVIESSVAYKQFPELAIQFYERNLCYPVEDFVDGVNLS